MIPSYHMVVINLILVTLLSLGTLFYMFIYPKKKINLFILLILVSIIPIISIFRAGSYESGDLQYHTLRTISYFDVLIKEHTLPRWNADFYGGFGDPYPMFAYQFPYFLASLLHLIGFTFLDSAKLVFATSFIFSGIFMYWFIKEEFKDKLSAFVSAIFYLFAPYHLIDMHFRATIAENLSFVFPPIILLLSKKYFDKGKIKHLLLLTLCFFLLILTHQVTVVSFLPIVFIYAILKIKARKLELSKIINYFLFLFFAVWISAFYWFPIFIESKYTSLTPEISFANSFWDIIYSPYRLGFLFQGHNGELIQIIGYTQIIVILFSLILLFKRKVNKDLKALLMLSLAFTFLYLFMMFSPSGFIWNNVPMIKNFQFASRLFLVISFLTAICAAIVIKTINRKWITLALVILTIDYTILNWGNRTMIKMNDEILHQVVREIPHDTNGIQVTAPYWLDKTKLPLNMSQIEVVSGNAEIKQKKITPYLHSYVIDVKTNSEFRERTIFFPGWNLYVNKKTKVINYLNNNYPGIITFTLPKGKFNVELKFEDTWDRTISYQISLTGMGAMALYLFFISKKKSSTK